MSGPIRLAILRDNSAGWQKSAPRRLFPEQPRSKRLVDRSSKDTSVFAVTEPGSVPVAYTSWLDWRIDKRQSTDFDPLPLVPSATCFCAMCWGQGRIWSPARNGEGLIPQLCTTCFGQRVVPIR
jgi:hypothetical protein